MQLIVDNRWLSQAITDLRKVIKLSRHHSLFSDGRIEQSLAEHRLILDALGNLLRNHPELTKVRIEGHTDNEGVYSYFRFNKKGV